MFEYLTGRTRVAVGMVEHKQKDLDDADDDHFI
jgi:hypothetical protein